MKYNSFQEAFIKESIQEGTVLNKELKRQLIYRFGPNEDGKKILSMLTNERTTHNKETV